MGECLLVWETLPLAWSLEASGLVCCLPGLRSHRGAPEGQELPGELGVRFGAAAQAALGGDPGRGRGPAAVPPAVEVSQVTESEAGSPEAPVEKAEDFKEKDVGRARSRKRRRSRSRRRTKGSRRSRSRAKDYTRRSDRTSSARPRSSGRRKHKEVSPEEAPVLPPEDTVLDKVKRVTFVSPSCEGA